jgi:hypothetical protein
MPLYELKDYIRIFDEMKQEENRRVNAAKTKSAPLRPDKKSIGQIIPKKSYF